MFEERKQKISEFNSTSRYVKRGLALQLYSHPMGAKGDKTFYHAQALVHVAADGTVRICHQGIEMGQGLHTKILAVVAHELKVPVSNVFVAASQSNSLGYEQVPTGGSTGSEANAAALIKACSMVWEKRRAIEAHIGGDLGPHSSWADRCGQGTDEFVHSLGCCHLSGSYCVGFGDRVQILWSLARQSSR